MLVNNVQKPTAVPLLREIAKQLANQARKENPRVTQGVKSAMAQVQQAQRRPAAQSKTIAALKPVALQTASRKTQTPQSAKPAPALEVQKEPRIELKQEPEVVFAPLPTLSDIEAALESEIIANIESIEEAEAKWFWTKDVSEEKNLVAKLAIKLADVLKKLLDQIFAIRKTRPLSAEEELELADIARRLGKVYLLSTLSVNAVSPEVTKALKEKAAKAQNEAENAELRAKAMDKKAEKVETLGKTIQAFQEWVATSHCDKLRELPIINRFFWSTQSAKMEIAQMQIKLAKESICDLLPYPEQLKPKLEKLVEAKKDLAKLQKQGTKENLANSREICEFQDEIQKLEKKLQK